MASERLHTDIVRLLDEHVPRSPQVLSVVPNAAGQLIGRTLYPQGVYEFYLNLLCGKSDGYCF